MMRVVMIMPFHPDGDAEDLGDWGGCAGRFVGKVVVLLPLTDCSSRLLAIRMGLSSPNRSCLRTA